jgi:hypothetical protein
VSGAQPRHRVNSDLLVAAVWFAVWLALFSSIPGEKFARPAHSYALQQQTKSGILLKFRCSVFTINTETAS